jgi:hypothetical protein
MVLEIPRRRFLRAINSKYIYGKVVSHPFQEWHDFVSAMLRTSDVSRQRLHPD